MHSLTILFGAMLALFDPPATQPGAPAVDVRSPPELIAALDHADSRQRRAAADELVLRGAAMYEPLRAAFRGARNYRERRAVRSVVKRIYLEEGIPQRPFLGIQLDLRDVQNDPRVPRDGVGILVTGIIAGTGAEAADLRPGDLIVALNGRPLAPTTENGRALTDWIAKQKVGTECELTFYRGDRPLTVRARLGRRPLSALGGAGTDDVRRLQERISRFPSWWVQQFDSQRLIDPDVPSVEDNAWRLQPSAPSDAAH